MVDLAKLAPKLVHDPKGYTNKTGTRKPGTVAKNMNRVISMTYKMGTVPIYGLAQGFDDLDQPVAADDHGRAVAPIAVPEGGAPAAVEDIERRHLGDPAEAFRDRGRALDQREARPGLGDEALHPRAAGVVAPVDVVPLSLTGMISSLQTGMIDAVNLPPLFALLNESYRLAPNMVSLRWIPLVAGTVISLKSWERIPADLRPRMLEAARKTGALLREDIRRMDKDAVAEMEKRGLRVTNLQESELTLWLEEAEQAYPRLRGRYAPADLFDEVLRLRNEFRSQN